MNLKKADRTIAILFAAATIVLITVFFTNKAFFEWAFARHRNTLSWYIRPLFIIPIVAGAYKKSYAVIAVSIFSLFTSMFWFPQPVESDERVIGFLNFEKDYLTSGWTADKVFVAVAVALFFVFLIFATWNRKWKWLLLVVVVSAVLKVLHSIFFSGEYGLSIIRPAVAGLIVCIAAIVFFIRKKR